MEETQRSAWRAQDAQPPFHLQPVRGSLLLSSIHPSLITLLSFDWRGCDACWCVQGACVRVCVCVSALRWIDGRQELSAPRTELLTGAAAGPERPSVSSRPAKTPQCALIPGDRSSERAARPAERGQPSTWSISSGKRTVCLGVSAEGAIYVCVPIYARRLQGSIVSLL